jgi:hypothetical protein
MFGGGIMFDEGTFNLLLRALSDNVWWRSDNGNSWGNLISGSSNFLLMAAIGSMQHISADQEMKCLKASFATAREIWLLLVAPTHKLPGPACRQYQRTGGKFDIIVTKLNATGSALLDQRGSVDWKTMAQILTIIQADTAPCFETMVMRQEVKSTLITQEIFICILHSVQ